MGKTSKMKKSQRAQQSTKSRKTTNRQPIKKAPLPTTLLPASFLLQTALPNAETGDYGSGQIVEVDFTKLSGFLDGTEEFLRRSIGELETFIGQKELEVEECVERERLAREAVVKAHQLLKVLQEAYTRLTNKPEKQVRVTKEDAEWLTDKADREEPTTPKRTHRKGKRRRNRAWRNRNGFLYTKPEFVRLHNHLAERLRGEVYPVEFAALKTVARLTLHRPYTSSQVHWVLKRMVEARMVRKADRGAYVATSLKGWPKAWQAVLERELRAETKATAKRSAIPTTRLGDELPFSDMEMDRELTKPQREVLEALWQASKELNDNLGTGAVRMIHVCHKLADTSRISKSTMGVHLLALRKKGFVLRGRRGMYRVTFPRTVESSKLTNRHWRDAADELLQTGSKLTTGWTNAMVQESLKQLHYNVSMHVISQYFHERWRTGKLVRIAPGHYRWAENDEDAQQAKKGVAPAGGGTLRKRRADWITVAEKLLQQQDEWKTGELYQALVDRQQPVTYEAVRKGVSRMLRKEQLAKTANGRYIWVANKAATAPEAEG